jgi:hypothetical protein
VEEKVAYTENELKELKRLKVRQLCKEFGMSSSECSNADFDDMVQFVLDNQEGSKKSSKSSKSSKSDKSNKSNSRTTRGRKRSGKSESKSESKSDKPKESKESDDSALFGDKILDFLETVVDEVKDLGREVKILGEKIDTIGECVDSASGSSPESNGIKPDDIEEIKINAFEAREAVFHVGKWLHSSGCVDDGSAPDSLNMEELEKELSNCGSDDSSK